MNVLFLVEAGGHYGLGHLMRSAVLADALRGRGHRSTLALRAGEGGLPQWSLPAAECIDLAGDDQAAAAQAEALAAAQRPDWIVVDGYGLMGQDLPARARKLGARVVAFDDLGSEGGGADLVINANVAGGDARDGRLLGPAYALIDRSYLEARNRPGRHVVRNVMITFGGSDLHGLTPRVVAAFAEVPGELSINVVAGPYHKARDIPSPGRHRLTVHRAPQGLAALMADADLMVSAAGSTCWQACCVGLPLLAIQTVDNQGEVLQQLSASGCAVTMEREEFMALVERGGFPALIAPLMDPARRAAMRTAQRATVDGGGAARIVAAMGA
jgi:UDP-2,4-diacetamido-2,4,6-trideoxy-beta-L-altropyranose hydrolase